MLASWFSLNKEHLRASLGAALGILIIAVVSRWLLGHVVDPSIGNAVTSMALWLIAPIGASAVILFALPSSPLAQPWPVLGSNTIAAIVGVTCVNTISDPAIAAAVSVGITLALMFLCKCFHPPGGATALLVVVLQLSSYKFVLFPVLFNVALLVGVAFIYNNLTGQPYPLRKSRV